jgi:spore germination protein KB
MKNPSKIGAGQLLLVIFLSRVEITLTYGVSAGVHSVNNADWLASLFMPILLTLLALPTFWFLKVSGNGDVCTFAYGIGKGIGRITSFLYGVLFLVLAFSPISRFSFFVTSVMQPEKGHWFFPILIILPVCFGAIKGVQAIVRTGALLSVVSILSIVVIVSALIDRLDMLNVYSPFYDGVREVADSLSLMVANSMELSIILMLAPRVKGSLPKAYFGYVCLVTVFLFLVMFTVVAVLGEFAQLQLFPFYSVAGVAKIGELSNLSALEASVWIVGVFIKSALYLYLSANCFCHLFPSRLRTVILLVLGAVVAVLAALTSANVTNAQRNFSTAGSLVVQGIFLVLFPILLAVTGKIKRRMYGEKMFMSAD